ncbi:MAG TPA: hypothetical protein VFF00_07155 [Candidatus Elarobacter sp.]|nr:hypothetical protein [Dongiaceae bacterium]HZW53794.1 hypothetical protein [Candidatus Elarobacter sp.]
MNRYLAIAAFGAASLAATGAALAAPAPPLLHAETGSALAYHVVFDGSFWNGAKTAFARDVRLTVLGGGAIGVVSAGPAKDDAANAQGTLRKNGEIDVRGASDRVRSYNTIVQILRTAPASIEPGSTWTASVPMQFNDTDATADFPVTVKAVSDPSGLVLQGTGAQTITTTYGGYSVPIDVDVRLALRLTPNGFDRCDFAASEVVHAGPQTQTLSWKWAMTAAAAAPKV